SHRSSRRHDRARWRRSRRLSGSLISDKEQYFVFQDRTAKGAAELVALDGIVARSRSRRGELHVMRIHHWVAQELEGAAVVLIRTGLSYDVDHSAGVHAIAGRLTVALYVELLNRVRKWERRIHIGEGVVVIAAVEQVVVRILLPAADGDRL